MRDVSECEPHFTFRTFKDFPWHAKVLAHFFNCAMYTVIASKILHKLNVWIYTETHSFEAAEHTYSKLLLQVVAHSCCTCMCTWVHCIVLNLNWLAMGQWRKSDLIISQVLAYNGSIQPPSQPRFVARFAFPTQLKFILEFSYLHVHEIFLRTIWVHSCCHEHRFTDLTL